MENNQHGADWLKQAAHAIMDGRTLNGFVGSCLPENRGAARAAYLTIASDETAQTTGAGNLPRNVAQEPASDRGNGTLALYTEEQLQDMADHSEERHYVPTHEEAVKSLAKTAEVEA